MWGQHRFGRPSHSDVTSLPTSSQACACRHERTRECLRVRSCVWVRDESSAGYLREGDYLGRCMRECVRVLGQMHTRSYPTDLLAVPASASSHFRPRSRTALDLRASPRKSVGFAGNRVTAPATATVEAKAVASTPAWTGLAFASLCRTCFLFSTRKILGESSDTTSNLMNAGSIRGSTAPPSATDENEAPSPPREGGGEQTDNDTMAAATAILRLSHGMLLWVTSAD